MTDAPDMEPAALEAATKAVTSEINRYWQDDTVEPGHEPVAAAAVRAYLSAARSAPEAGKAVVKLLDADDVEWVANDNAELGVKIGNRFFFLYKGRSLVYSEPVHDDGSPMYWRPVFKREFGECCHPINYNDPTLIGTVSLEDSNEWRPLPAAIASSPSPTGAEPVAWQIGECGALYPTKEAADKHVAGWARQNIPCASPRPLYAQPQPLAPTGEIAGLVERLRGRRRPLCDGKKTWVPEEICQEAAAALTSSEAEAADLRKELENANLDRCFATDSDPACKLEHKFNEEAADLRRKMEEARKALEEVRGHFRVEYPISVGGKPSIGYDSEALPKVIAILDRTLSGASQ